MRDELERLLADLPILGTDDKPAGPKIEVPPALVHYWQWNQSTSTWRHYELWKLKAVQKIRLAELCRYYGWREGTSPKATMYPLRLDRTRSRRNDRVPRRSSLAVKERGHELFKDSFPGLVFAPQAGRIKSLLSPRPVNTAQIFPLQTVPLSTDALCFLKRCANHGAFALSVVHETPGGKSPDAPRYTVIPLGKLSKKA